ncbi:MAG: PorT family protein [Bacteroidales bacterium]|nr:PorT family protein [Bacteroidales bacterium]
MKKIVCLLTACALALSISFSANAQVKFGVKGSLQTSNLSGGIVSDLTDVLRTYTGFNAGVVLNVQLPLGFALQPEVLYSQNGSNIKLLPEGGALDKLLEDYKTSFVIGSIQVPVGLQWGIKLGPVRPYAQLVPYIGFPLSFKVKSQLAEENTKLEKEVFNTLDYGIGAGIGLDVWKLQASVKYNWALGKLVDVANKDFDKRKGSEILDKINGAKLSGLEVSLAIFF